MLIEICGSKKTAQENYKKGLWAEWTPKRIKGAFQFGDGTIDDLKRFARDNAGAVCIYDTDKGAFII